ncbi:MAG: hypothetical protein ACTJG2_02660 [Candidatus Saccharimonadales bacterium]
MASPSGTPSPLGTNEQPEDKGLSAINYDSILEVQQLERQEAGGGGTAKAEDVSETKKTIKESSHQKPQEKKGKWYKGGGPLAFFAVTVLLLGAAATILLSPSLMLVNMKENLVNDLNDSVGAYYTFTKKVLEEQIGGGSCNEASIECKFATMSPMLKKRFEDQGIKVTATQNNDTKRYNVSNVSLPNGNGSASSGKALNDLATKIDDVQYRLDNAVDPKNGLFHDRKFEDRLFEKFHLPHRPTVFGLEREDIDESFNNSLEKEADYIDQDGRGVFGLHYLAESRSAWQNDIYNNLVDKSHTHMALACALYSYGNLADDAVRRAKMTTLARFAMQYVAMADTIKSGNNADYEMVISALSDKLSIPDDEGKNGLDGSSFRVPAMQQKVNTYMPYDRDYMNDPSQMLDLLNVGGGAPGYPGTSHLRATQQRVPGAGSSAYTACASGMSGAQASKERGGLCWSPGAMPVAGHVGPVGAGAIQGMKQQIEELICPLAGLQAVVNLTKTAIRTEARSAMTSIVPTAAREEARRFSAGTVGVAAQDAVFAGTGIILGDVAQSIGMRPASVSSLRQYLTQTAPAHRTIARSEQIAAAKNQFDVTNQHTFVGSLARNMIGSRTEGFSSLADAATSVLGILPRASVAAAVPAANALYSQPLNFDFTRLISAANSCGLTGDLAIDPDFGCNIRYSMDDNDLGKSISDVVGYMTEAHPDNARESLSEVQGRDTAADASEGNRMKREASEGANQSYVDKATGKPNMNSEYGKFIRYCTNRDYTWGSIGMATEYQEREYEPDGRDPFNDERRIYSGATIEYEDKEHEPPEQMPASTFGIAWGSSVDQDWLSGKKCLEASDMMSNFRAYTAACRVLAGISGARECWLEDAEPTFQSGFYSRNDIIFTKEN